MRRPVRLACALAVAVACAWPITAQERPRLIVVVVIDQFRADYLTLFASHWRNGFKTLLADGALFRRAQYPYLHTDTCAGHATIGTGTFPRTHGWIADNWYAPEVNKVIECTEDEMSPTVTYGRASRQGNGLRWLQVPTFADELRRQQPAARVVTMSLKARSAMALAGHGGTAVTWFEDNTGTFTTARAYASAPVPEVKRIIDARPYEADLGAAWTLRDPPAAYRFPDAGVSVRPPAGWSGLFPHVLRGQKEKEVDNQFWTEWRHSPMSDAYLTRLATSLIDAYALGRRDPTDFLGVSFSAVDYIGHTFGTDSRELEDAVARMDDRLGELIAALDTKVGRERYVLALTADHGATAIPSTAAGTGRIAHEDVRDAVEELLRDRWGTRDGRPWVIASVAADIYLSPEARDRLRREPATVRAIQQAVARIPGIERLLYVAELSEGSSDSTVRAAALSTVVGRSGDFTLITKRGWVLSGRAGVNATNHTAGNDDDRRVPIVLLGAGVRRGVYDTAATPADIAPTMASLTGVTLSAVDGRVLREALVTPASSR